MMTEDQFLDLIEDLIIEVSIAVGDDDYKFYDLATRFDMILREHIKIRDK